MRHAFCARYTGSESVSGESTGGLKKRTELSSDMHRGHFVKCVSLTFYEASCVLIFLCREHLVVLPTIRVFHVALHTSFSLCSSPRTLHAAGCDISRKIWSSLTDISTGRLNMLPCVDRRPIDQIISLDPLVSLKEKGWLILRGASHLDAFSGYPVQT